jgi:ATP-binding cassette subfamily B protein
MSKNNSRESGALPKKFSAFIWYFLQDYKFVAIVYVLLAITSGLMPTFNNLVIKKLINLLPNVKKENISDLILPANLIVVFIIIDNLTWRGISYICAKFVPIISNNVIGELTDNVLNKSQKFYQDNLSGKISKQIINLASGIESIITNLASNFLRSAALLITSLIATYLANPIFCLIMIIWFALFTIISIMMSKKLVYLADEQASAESVVVGEIVDTLANQLNIRIFAQRSYEKLRLIPFFKRQQKAYTATYFYSLTMHTIQGGLISAMMAFLFYFLIHLYGKNKITIGDFALILGLSIETSHTIWFAMSEFDEFSKLIGRCKQSLISLIVPLEIKDKVDAPPLKYENGKINFYNVGFYYTPGKIIFHNNSVEINGGQKVGLVGYSGGGKSTFVNLILRFYDVTSGSITIDGQNISDVTQDSLYRNISMIPQTPSLFNRSIMENIRYGRIDATDEEVIEAAKKAHAHNFIVKLSEGYETLVGERGMKISGGQRQRIAIARAILKNAPILILDEATSQLDSLTENLIQDSLLKLMHNKTTLVVAHRLSTLLHMDRILVFDKGKILEDGTHNELLLTNGLYKKMWDSQLGGFLGDRKQ